MDREVKILEAAKSLVIGCREQTKDDGAFIEAVSKLIEDNGNIICQAVFTTFADLDLSPESARNHWNQLLAHKQKLDSALGRSINLISAMADFFSLNAEVISRPKLVEMRVYDRASRESTHDGLTGLYNRAFMTSALEQNIALAKRYQNDLSLLFLDADDFKDVNDTYGHGIGDDALKFIAKIILEEIRESDVAVRYGGEEFVVLMPQTSSIDALILADRIREKIELTPLDIDETQHIRLTVSGGIATYPMNAARGEELVNLADSALYRAKGAGKNNISLFKADKRRFLRIALQEEIMVKELGFTSYEAFSGDSKDICVGGLLFEASRKLDIGTRIQLNVPIGTDEPILLIGTVVRVEVMDNGKFDIGVVIAFKEMDKLAKSGISRFLVQHVHQAIPS